MGHLSEVKLLLDAAKVSHAVQDLRGMLDSSGRASFAFADYTQIIAGRPVAFSWPPKRFPLFSLLSEKDNWQ